MAQHNPAAHNSQSPLAGMQIPAPVSQKFCAPYVALFVIDQKVLTLSSGKFCIRDAQGNIMFEVKGKHALALHMRRVVLDASGTPLVLLKQRLATMHDRWEAYRGESDNASDLLFSMMRSSVIQFKPSFHIFLPGNNSEDPDFTLKGDFFAHKYSVLYRDTAIAEVSKKINVASVFGGKDQYGVTVYPGVDHAFIASVIVIVDQVKQQEEQVAG